MYRYYYSEQQKGLYGSELVLVNDKWVEYTILEYILGNQKIYEKYYRDIKVVAESEKPLPTKKIEKSKQGIKNITSITLINSTTGETVMSFNGKNAEINFTNNSIVEKVSLEKFIEDNSFETHLNNLMKDIDESLRQGNKYKFMELSDEYKRLVEM